MYFGDISLLKCSLDCRNYFSGEQRKPSTKVYLTLGNHGTGEKYILLIMELFPLVTVPTFYFQIRLYILKAEIQTIAQWLPTTMLQQTGNMSHSRQDCLWGAKESVLLKSNCSFNSKRHWKASFPYGHIQTLTRPELERYDSSDQSC